MAAVMHPDFPYLWPVKPLTFDDVQAIWRENEIDQEHWKKFWRERGFNSWEEWRQPRINAVRATNKEWQLYLVVDPLKAVPEFHGGPYKGWRDQFYEGATMPAFKDIREHWAAAEFLANFPNDTTLIGWLTRCDSPPGEVVIVEGMHRCAAVTKASREGRPFGSMVYLAGAEIPFFEIPDFTADPILPLSQTISRS